MSSDAANRNAFTHGPLGAIYAKTALPIIFVMSMNGLQAVIDAVFLGVFVGPEALGAVTLMFPFFMIIIALATLVGSGMSSILSRRLGAGHFDEARSVFAGAHGLALAVSCCLIVLFLVFGGAVTRLAADGSPVLEHLGYVYLRILVLSSPVFFVMAVNVDALRIEGRTGFMAAMSLLISLANIGFTYVLIVVMEMGVAGSAYGTALAQALALSIIVVFRVLGRTQLRPGALLHHSPLMGWQRILALGAPQSLNFMGIALVSASIIAALQLSGGGSYQATVSAYGIITRIMTFVFLPLLGLSQALQAIVGNNYGAEAWTRSNSSLRLGLMIAFVYCIAAECALVLFAEPIGFAFVDDRQVVSEVVRILPVMTAMYFISGPLVMIAMYFQSIGDAGRAAVLGLAKPYAFVIPMIFLLPLAFGEQGIWIATPVAELLLLGLTTVVLIATARRRNLRWGLFVPVT
ncbi:MATE family efflux transporter [Roseibium sp.]|uniref:MATE family efflux transporter n=1 Tax=Roseibium sp. TaxID=1936156 RepID=UPI003A96C2DA